VLTACQLDLGGPSAPVDERLPSPDVGAAGAAPGSAASVSVMPPPPSSAGGMPNEGVALPAGPVAAGGAASAGCDLEGRWLVVQRDGINVPSPRVDQAIQSWLYYEVEQDGSALSVTKGLDCGYRVMPLPPPPAPTLAATGDASAAWPGILANDTHTGRTGSYVAEGSGCRLHLDDEFSIRGATAAYFEDPSRPLPAPGSPPASAGMPGWEDWDADGKPGITVKLDSVLVRGEVHVVSRERSVFDGPTPAASDLFEVAVRWTLEQSTLATTPPNDAFLATGGIASAAPAAHYAYFLALDAGQGTGSDAEICDEMRALANSLPAEANQ
jgi:hypothetical protein